MDMIDELTLLGDEEIDYTSLTDDILSKLTLGDDLFIATSALSELASRRSPQVVPIAKEILCQSVGDRYLQAAAIESLFHLSPEQAMVYIKSYHGARDSYITDSVLQLMGENPFYFDSIQPKRALPIQRQPLPPLPIERKMGELVGVSVA